MSIMSSEFASAVTRAARQSSPRGAIVEGSTNVRSVKPLVAMQIFASVVLSSLVRFIPGKPAPLTFKLALPGKQHS